MLTPLGFVRSGIFCQYRLTRRFVCVIIFALVFTHEGVSHDIEPTLAAPSIKAVVSRASGTQ